MTGMSYNPAAAADAEQHAQQELVHSGAKVSRRSAAGARLSAAALAAAWVAVRRILARGRRAADPSCR